MSHNTELLTAKHLGLFTGKKLLCIEPPSTGIVQQLKNIAETAIFSSDCRVIDAASAAVVDLTSSGSFDATLLFLPKSKALRDMLLHWAHSQLPLGSTIFVVGENKGGIKSAQTYLQKTIGETKKVASGKHCMLYQATVGIKSKPFNLSQYQTEQNITARGQQLTTISLPGVFAHGQLDEGTELLLSAVPPLRGSVLDIGCGNGVISNWLLKRQNDLDITATDVSTLATYCTGEALTKNGFTAKVKTSDVFGNIKGRFDTIISNPPFHDGLDTSYSAVTRLITQAPNHLTSSGRFIIVANRHLKYADWLSQTFNKFEVLAETNRFKVYCCYMRHHLQAR